MKQLNKLFAEKFGLNPNTIEFMSGLGYIFQTSRIFRGIGSSQEVNC